MAAEDNAGRGGRCPPAALVFVSPCLRRFVLAQRAARAAYPHVPRVSVDGAHHDRPLLTRAMIAGLQHLEQEFDRQSRTPALSFE